MRECWHLLCGAAHFMQDVKWQVDMRSVVLCVKDCLFVLLVASIDTATDADIDSMSEQPYCGWKVVNFVH